MADIGQVLATGGTALVSVAAGAGTHRLAWLPEPSPPGGERGLADESTVGLPKWLGEAYGPLYGEDVIDSRMPTPEERERLEIPPDTPVTEIKGVNRDAQHRPLHYIVKVTPSVRFLYGYRFGIVPES
jgi:hypothetical protein